MILKFPSASMKLSRWWGRVWTCVPGSNDTAESERTTCLIGKLCVSFHMLDARNICAEISKIPGTKRVDHKRAVKMYERGGRQDITVRLVAATCLEGLFANPTPWSQHDASTLDGALSIISFMISFKRKAFLPRLTLFEIARVR